MTDPSIDPLSSFPFLLSQHPSHFNFGSRPRLRLPITNVKNNDVIVDRHYSARNRAQSAVAEDPPARLPVCGKRLNSISSLPTIPSPRLRRKMSYPWESNNGYDSLVNLGYQWSNNGEEKKRTGLAHEQAQGTLHLSGMAQPSFYPGGVPPVSESQLGLGGDTGSSGFVDESTMNMPPPQYNFRPGLALDTGLLLPQTHTQPFSAYPNSPSSLVADPGSNVDTDLVTSGNPSQGLSIYQWTFPAIQYINPIATIPQNGSTESLQQNERFSSAQPMYNIYDSPVVSQNNFFSDDTSSLPQNRQQSHPELGTISPSELGNHQPLKPTKSFNDLMMGSRASSTSSMASQDVSETWNGNTLDNWAVPIARALPSSSSSNKPHSNSDQHNYQSTARRPSMTSPLRQSSSSNLPPQRTTSANEKDALVKAYYHSANRLAMGERKITVMSPKVGQKSYGTEKRFLCPHPQALLIGPGWWNQSPDASSPFIQPPRANVSLSGELPVKDAPVSWTDMNGDNMDEKLNTMGIKSEDRPFVGSVAGKNLHISDNDPKRKEVKALVSVKVPLNRTAGTYGWGGANGGSSAPDVPNENLIGVFESKDIKIISKPSKKRATAKSGELTISHGTTIALFNRVKSQTTSTRYLSVVPDFTQVYGSDGRPINSAKSPNPPDNGAFRGLRADGAIWESWIIYLVDPTLPAGKSTNPPPHADWPSPPTNIIPLHAVTASIRYNSTVVLQSLQTGVISPVLVIRRIETDTEVVGMDGHVVEGQQSVPLGEYSGDLVSQLQKVAFEVFSPDSMDQLAKDSKHGGFWLSCNQESVKDKYIKAERKWSALGVPSSRPGSRQGSLPTTPQSRFGVLPMTPHTNNGMALPTTPSSPVSQSGDYFGYHSQWSSGHNSLTSPDSSDIPLPASTDGGPIRRQRTASVGKGILSRPLHRKRLSTDSSGSNPYDHYSSNLSGGGGVQEQRMFWTLDIGDSCVWSIISVEQTTYTFYMPPVTSYDGIEPVAPFPVAHRLLPPGFSSEVPAQFSHHFTSQANLPLVTIYGKRFSKNGDGGAKHGVYYGDTPAAYNEVRCQEVMAASRPKLHHDGKVPLFLVRDDGRVIVPTDLTYPI